MKKGAFIMKFSSFSTFIKDAFTNLLRNRLMSLATIITLAAGIFLFGVTSAMTLNVFSITNKLKTDFKLEIYIDEEYNLEENREKLESTLKSIYNVTEIEFVPKEKAFEEFKESFAQPELLEGIDDGSILRDSYKITLADLELSQDTVRKLEKVEGVAKVTQLADEMNIFLSIITKLQIATIILSIILGLLAVLIITNTINMSIMARGKQINIMKYVGATDSYIRIPFMIEGILIGIFSAAISYGGVMYLYYAAMGMIGSYTETFGILTISASAIPLLIIITGMGILLGCLGSSISIRKHLKV